jgi:hypothetical protein
MRDISPRASPIYIKPNTSGTDTGRIGSYVAL